MKIYRGNIYKEYIFKRNTISEGEQKCNFHWHYNTEILRIVEGKYKIIINKESFVASKGDIVIIKGGDVHAQIPMEPVCIKDKCIYGNRLDRFLNIPYHIKRYISYEMLKEYKIDIEVDQIFKRIIDEEKLKKSNYKMLVQIKLLELYALLSRYFKTKENTNYNKKNFQKFQQALYYIEENYMNDITLSDIAENLHYHKNYVSKLFSEFTNVGFKAYLNTLRVNKAIEMLETGEYKILNVIEKSGFNSQNVFNSSFKKIMGMSPRDYLKKINHIKF